MDEREFQQVRKQLNQHPCPFEKAIFSSFCCTKCQRLNIAERETAACLSATAQARCIILLEQLYQNARFAIKTVRLVVPQPHAKAMKVQCGGLIGLQSVLVLKETFDTKKEGFETKQIKDIDALVTQALEQLGSIEKFPYQEIVKFISHYQVRAKRAHS
ncbi:MAG: hypothetical protein KAI83_00360 [Thiomargarita sp.]|nr:hypothetical protein [Thiomargarita sp.]